MSQVNPLCLELNTFHNKFYFWTRRLLNFLRAEYLVLLLHGTGFSGFLKTRTRTRTEKITKTRTRTEKKTRKTRKPEPEPGDNTIKNPFLLIILGPWGIFMLNYRLLDYSEA